MGVNVVLGYVGLLLIAGLTTPGVGLVGELIAGVGSELMSWLHVPAFALLCWMIAEEFRRRDWPPLYAWTVAVGGTLVFGLWLEVLQGRVEGRVTAWEDLAVDALGIALAAGLATWKVQALRPARLLQKTKTLR